MNSTDSENPAAESKLAEAAEAAERSGGSEAHVKGLEPEPVPRPGIALWIATAGGVGFGPWAPGTWGALVAVLCFGLGLSGIGLPAYALIVVLVSLIGIWASDVVEPWMGKSDDGRIVIDEVAGQLITLAPLVVLHDVPLGRLPLPAALGAGDSALTAALFSDSAPFWFLVVTAFVAFRWFDIRKPGPVKWAERRFKGGLGVMADDIVAGVLGAVVVMAPAYMFVVSRLEAQVEEQVQVGWLEGVMSLELMMSLEGFERLALVLESIV
jgi:phosphatidylglycerophosphatase A